MMGTMNNVIGSGGAWGKLECMPSLKRAATTQQYLTVAMKGCEHGVFGSTTFKEKLEIWIFF